ncbi:MAG TPA: hypothetical protein DF613_07810 [Lachnospiraceae bacterium]|nr:hypothetical protein [Lachnospiraceae bacterium]
MQSPGLNCYALSLHTLYFLFSNAVCYVILVHENPIHQKENYVMRKYAVALLLSALVLSLSGCGKQKETSVDQNQTESQSSSMEQDSSQTQNVSPEQSSSVLFSAAEENSPDSAADSENADASQSDFSDRSASSNDVASTEEKSQNDSNFSFSDLKNLQFCFSSGAGGWATLMMIDADGSFSGEYTDSDMGDTGDGYPNGTLYQCIFEGNFTVPEKIDEYTYSMQIDKIDWEKEADSQEIKDGTLYQYTTPYGLEDAKNILLYLPGTPLAEIPEECKSWISTALFGTSGTELPFYVLYNENMQCGFSSYSIAESFEETLAYIEDTAASLEDSIENDPLTQAEYNEKTLELYELWDSALNTLWDTLKQTLDAETMNTLTAEQKDWITKKESEVEKSGAEFEGGSMQPMIQNSTAAEMTKDRVYELKELYL